MNAALDQFRENHQRAQELVQLTHAIDELTTEAIDLEDLLRAALVLGVSALDHFVHEYVLCEMLEVHKGHRQATDPYLRFSVPLAAAHEGMNDLGGDDWLANAIRASHSFLAFQQPDKIADAIRLISNVPLWQEVGNHLGLSAADIKTELKIIVDRRNKIAHEADMDPTYPGTRWQIDEQLTMRSLGFVVDVAEAIAAVT